MKTRLILASLFLIIMYSSSAVAATCIDAEGEAVITNNDVPSAKAEAIARAKWAAVENVSGVAVKSQTVVQNMMLVDEAISREIKGVISGYRVLNVDKRAESVAVKINACVEPAMAQRALKSLALNSGIAVLIPIRKPRTVNESVEVRDSRRNRIERRSAEIGFEHEESNIFSTNLIEKLTDHGYTVVDVAPAHVVDAMEVERALKSGNFISLRSLTHKFLANILLVGQIDYTVSTAKGENIGYGISMPFNSVTVRLTYRLLTGDASGRLVTLTAGSASGKGLAGAVDDAVSNALQDLSESLTPTILDKVGKYVKGVARKVTVRVSGVTELSDNFAVKEILQNISWVSEVEEKGLGEFWVSYSENPIYLANSLVRNGLFKLVAFSTSTISLAYQKN
jgi:hypothetical protein